MPTTRRRSDDTSPAGADHEGQDETTQRYIMPTNDIRDRLLAQVHERLAAERAGLAAEGAYIANRDGDVEGVRAAYIGAVVTEIAMLRADLGNRTTG